MILAQARGGSARARFCEREYCGPAITPLSHRASKARGHAGGAADGGILLHVRGQKAAPRHVGLESQDRRGQGKWRERGVTPEGGPGEGAGADARALSSCIYAQVCLRHMGFLGYLTGFVADSALIHTSLSLSD